MVTTMTLGQIHVNHANLVHLQQEMQQATTTMYSIVRRVLRVQRIQVKITNASNARQDNIEKLLGLQVEDAKIAQKDFHKTNPLNHFAMHVYQASLVQPMDCLIASFVRTVITNPTLLQESVAKNVNKEDINH